MAYQSSLYEFVGMNKSSSKETVTMGQKQPSSSYLIHSEISSKAETAKADRCSAGEEIL